MEHRGSDAGLAVNRPMESELEQVSDVLVANYRESLKLTQRAIFFGLMLAGTVHYLEFIGETHNLPKLPFFSVEFTSLETLQITLLVLYTGAGCVAWFAISKAFQNLTSIKGAELAIAVSKYPCLAVTNFWFGALLAGVLLGIGATIMMSIFDFSSIYQKSLYFIISIPFWATLRMGGMLYSWENKIEREAGSDSN